MQGAERNRRRRGDREGTEGKGRGEKQGGSTEEGWQSQERKIGKTQRGRGGRPREREPGERRAEGEGKVTASISQGPIVKVLSAR